jgi:FMN-dependent NADH-azoreductase
VTLLDFQSSPRGESSDSIALTTSFIEACESGNSSMVVDTLNVWHEQLPEFDHKTIGARISELRWSFNKRKSIQYGR